MVSEGTLALLSACRFLLTGKDLQVARGQLRMTVGCLEALAKLWPRIAMILWEIKTTARHVLCLEAASSNGMHHQDDGPASDHGAAS